MSEYTAIGLAFLFQLVLQTEGVAPNDYSITCRTDFQYRQAHDWIPYANDTSSGTWKVLIDQYDYQSILGFGGVWKAIDADTQPTPDGITFTQGSGGTCSYQIRVSNSYRNSNSNNWVFTQAIDYLDAVELIVNATVRFSSCIQRHVANPPCRNDYVILQHYDTNTLSETQRIKPTNYQPYNGTSESSRLEHNQINPDDDTTIIGRFRRPANFNYTYLGLQDIGTIGIVSRIFIYYEVCPGRVEGLVTYPEVPHPGTLPGASSRTTRFARCAKHSHAITSLETYAYQDGRCDQSVMCDCDAGYEENGRQCVACTPGKYRTTPQNSSCVDCPANSNSSPAASECSCSAGYYRVSGSEGIGVGCTAPPPPISNCIVSQQFDTAIDIQWRSPANCGGRSDCYYQIRINNDSPKRISPVFRPNNQETFTVENLQPATTYSITVSIHNGVSDQDPDNARNRECIIVATTSQGSVFMLGGITYLNNTVVLLEDIDSENPLICTTSSATCCGGSNMAGFYYPNGARITQNPASQSLYVIKNQGSISLNHGQQAGERPPLGRYRCQIPDGRGSSQNLYIRIGTAMERDITTNEPATISVQCPTESPPAPTVPPSCPIPPPCTDPPPCTLPPPCTPCTPCTDPPPCTVPPPCTPCTPCTDPPPCTIPPSDMITISDTIPPSDTVATSDTVPPSDTVTRDTQVDLPSASSTEPLCINLYIFIGVIVGIIVIAVVIVILTGVCLGVAYKRNKSKKPGSYGTHGNGMDNPVYSEK